MSTFVLARDTQIGDTSSSVGDIIPLVSELAMVKQILDLVAISCQVENHLLLDQFSEESLPESFAVFYAAILALLMASISI